MATFTPNLFVRTFQTVLSFDIVVKAPHRPTPRVMASFTLFTQLLLVLIFLFMTRQTISWRVFVSQCFVATLTSCIDMTPCQWETRQSVVKTCSLPSFVVVTNFTLDPYLSFVFIVFFVATQTIKRRIAEGCQVFMACRAFHFGFGMAILQRKFSTVVLKPIFGFFPILLIVAIGAQFAEIELMFVIFGMAAVTVFGSFFIQKALVALFALHLDVLSE
jgi:hypothetical protein